MYLRFCNKLAKVLSVFTGILLIVVLLCSVMNIIFRNILSISFLVIDVFSKLAFVWMIFIGASVVYYNVDHLKMDFFSGKFPEKMKKIVDFITIFLSLVLLLIMLIYGINVSLIRMTIPFEQYKTIPTGYLYLSLPVSAFIMIIFTVAHFIRLIKTGQMAEIVEIDQEELRKQEQEIKEGIEAFRQM